MSSSSVISYGENNDFMTVSERNYVENICVRDNEGEMDSEENDQEIDASFKADEAETSELNEGDLYAQLEQKEKDLLLAAELGKALLERNEELQQKSEQLQENYNRRVEVLEQERHEWKLKLERLQGLHDARTHELQADIKTLTEELQNERLSALTDQESKRTSLDQLMQQNETLRLELKWSKDRSNEIEEELGNIKRQLFKRRTLSEENRHNFYQLEVDELEEKVYQLEEDKAYMESTVNDLVQERDNLSKDVDKLCKDVEKLEKELIESKTQLSVCEEELNDTKDYNQVLQQQYDEVKIQTSHDHANNGSLYSELSHELSLTESEGPGSPSLGRAVLQTISSHFRHPQPLAASSSLNLVTHKRQRQSVSSLLSEDDDDDSDFDLNSPVRKNINIMKNVELYSQLEEEEKENTNLRRMMLDARNELQKLHHSMKCSRSNALAPSLVVHDDELREFDSKCLNPVIENLKEVVREMYPRSGNSSRRGSPTPEVSLLMNQARELESDLCTAKEQLKQLQEDFTKCSLDLEHKTQYAADLEHKFTIQEKDIDCLRKEKECLISQICGEVADAGYEKVVQDRKDALERENILSEELENAHADIANLDRQLMEAIQQKIQLSEQLEAWQVDIASLIEEQVQKQMRSTAKEQKQNDVHKKRRSTFGTITAGWSNWSNISKSNKPPVLNV